MTTLREKLIKIGAKIVRYGPYVTFQIAEVAVPKDLFRKILLLIDELSPRNRYHAAVGASPTQAGIRENQNRTALGLRTR